jgi:alpha-L-fucosidase
MGWPRDGVLRIASLGEESAVAPGTIERVEALGSAASLPFERSRRGLEVRLPEGLAGSIAIVLKIRGNGLA